MRKSFKIGSDNCKGGIIAVELDNRTITVIGKEWDFSAGSNRGSKQSNAKEFTRLVLKPNDNTAYVKLYDFLSDLTTSYYTDMVIDWIYSKKPFK